MSLVVFELPEFFAEKVEGEAVFVGMAGVKLAVGEISHGGGFCPRVGGAVGDAGGNNQKLGDAGAEDKAHGAPGSRRRFSAVKQSD